MACRNTYKTKTINVEADIAKTSITEPAVAKTVNRLKRSSVEVRIALAA